jgi:hypothetical protein
MADQSRPKANDYRAIQPHPYLQPFLSPKTKINPQNRYPTVNVLYVNIPRYLFM